MYLRIHTPSVVLSLTLLAASVPAAESPQFRGPNRDGIYPAEGLLEAWPEGGPKKRWSASGLGEGFASVAVAGGRLYTAGVRDHTESPLVIDGKVIFTPGGSKATLVALDAKSGKAAWASAAIGDSSAYCGPRLLAEGELRQIVTLTEKHLIGVDPDDGAVLWRQSYPGRYDIHAVSPLFQSRSIYVTDGYGQGGKMFELAADGKSARLEWEDSNLDVHHGGAVWVGGHIYGAANRGTWYALDAATGKVAADLPRAGKGA